MNVKSDADIDHFVKNSCRDDPNRIFVKDIVQRRPSERLSTPSPSSITPPPPSPSPSPRHSFQFAPFTRHTAAEEQLKSLKQGSPSYILRWLAHTKPQTSPQTQMAYNDLAPQRQTHANCASYPTTSSVHLGLQLTRQGDRQKDTAVTTHTTTSTSVTTHTTS